MRRVCKIRPTGWKASGNGCKKVFGKQRGWHWEPSPVAFAMVRAVPNEYPKRYIWEGASPKAGGEM